jgi:hypothetical protein
MLLVMIMICTICQPNAVLFHLRITAWMNCLMSKKGSSICSVGSFRSSSGEGRPHLFFKAEVHLTFLVHRVDSIFYHGGRLVHSLQPGINNLNKQLANIHCQGDLVDIRFFRDVLRSKLGLWRIFRVGQ